MRPLVAAILALCLVALPTPRAQPDPEVGLADGAGAGMLLVPDDPRLGQQPSLAQIRAPEAWDHSTGSTEASVCLVSTGIRATHEEFADRVVAGKDFANDDDDATDDHGHGTMMAGVAAAGIDNGVGIAGMGNVGILAAKVLTDTGSGTFADVAAGILWCAQTGGPRTVIALPLGTASANADIEAAIDAAIDAGALVVASIGSGPDVAFPARLPQVLAVGCTTIGEARCSFGATGPEIDLVAPGAPHVTTSHEADNAYAASNGTSWSTAVVAGALALYWSHDTSLTPAALAARALASAQDLGATGGDDSFGCGEIDLLTLFEGPPPGSTCGVLPLSPPRALTATRGPGAGEIALAWQAPTATGTSALAGYRVYTAPACDGAFVLVAELGAAAQGFTDTGLGNGVTRCYHARALNATDVSSPSNVAQATTYVPPGAPTDVRAEPGTGTGEVRVRWSLGPEGPTMGLIVERRDAGSEAFVEVARLGRQLGYNDHDLDLLGYHAYRVRAFNPAGESPYSGLACTRASPWPHDPALAEHECTLAGLWPSVPAP